MGPMLAASLPDHFFLGLAVFSISMSSTASRASDEFRNSRPNSMIFGATYNEERPHEALDMKCPAEVYRPSTREYKGLPDIDDPFHDQIIIVSRFGRICLGKKKINFSTVFAGQAVGIKEVQDDIWLVSFMDYDLGTLI
jgi:putative transposase